MYNEARRQDQRRSAGSNEFNVGDVNADRRHELVQGQPRRSAAWRTTRSCSPTRSWTRRSSPSRNGGFATIHPQLRLLQPGRLFLPTRSTARATARRRRVDDELKGFKVSANIRLRRLEGGLRRHGHRCQLRRSRKDQAPARRQHQPRRRRARRTSPPTCSTAWSTWASPASGYIPSWNVPAAVARYMIFAPNENASYLVAKAWTVDEKITTGYLKGNIDTTWGDHPGARQHRRAGRSAPTSRRPRTTGMPTQPAGQNVRPFEDGKTYTDVLPSLNLAFLLTDDQTLRFARPSKWRVRAWTRCAPRWISASTALPASPAPAAAIPQLDPWKANAFDVFMRKIFRQQGATWQPRSSTRI